MKTKLAYDKSNYNYNFKGVWHYWDIIILFAAQYPVNTLTIQKADFFQNDQSIQHIFKNLCYYNLILFSNDSRSFHVDNNACVYVERLIEAELNRDGRGGEGEKETG